MEVGFVALLVASVLLHWPVWLRFLLIGGVLGGVITLFEFWIEFSYRSRKLRELDAREGAAEEPG